MAHRRNASDEGDRPDDTYNSIKDQIERETLGLGFVNQREITNPFENRPYTAQVPVSENFSHVLAPRSRIFATEHEQKQTQAQKSNKRALKSKLKDIIDMSKEENRETGKGYKEIIFAER